MSRLIALEWDGREARIAVGRRRGKDLLLEQAFAVDLGPREAGHAAADPQIGVRLAAALAARRIGRGEALVSVGRTGIELRLLSVPPAPEAELPDLVRFQALRQFSSLGENWPLDFVNLNTGEDGGTNVLAAAISPELVQQIKTTCEGADITPTHLVLRPFAAASLVVRRLPDARCRLIVDLLTDEADLTVLDGAQVVFIRTVRLPAADDSEGVARQLLGEIRRTTVAAQNQLGGRAVERIVICDDGRDHATFKTRVEHELSLPVELFDPFASVELSHELRDDRPEHAGRFAPLLGILCDEAAGDSHAIDFLHTRKRPKPPNVRRRNSLIAAAIATLVVLAAGWFWLQLRSLDAHIHELGTTAAEQKKQVEELKKRDADAAEIDRFAAGDVTWLDELVLLSQKFPPGEKAIVTKFSAATATRQNGGLMTVEGKVRDSAAISDLEQQLRDTRHEVFGSVTTEDKKDSYPWRFKGTTITVKTEQEVKQPAKKPAPARSAAAASKTAAGARAAGRDQP